MKWVAGTTHVGMVVLSGPVSRVSRVMALDDLVDVVRLADRRSGRRPARPARSAGTAGQVTRPATAVPFARVEIVPEAQQAALDVLRSGWITMGPETAAFEHELADYLGARHVVAVASWTAAIEIALRALRLARGATVLTPSLTFCGAVAAIVQAGLRPVLVDVDAETLLPTPATVAGAARRAGRPAAMVVQHMAGHPADVAELAAAAGLPASAVTRTPRTGSAPNYAGSSWAATPTRPASASTRRRTCRSARAARSPPTTTSSPRRRARPGCTV